MADLATTSGPSPVTARRAGRVRAVAPTGPGRATPRTTAEELRRRRNLARVRSLRAQLATPSLSRNW